MSIVCRCLESLLALTLTFGSRSGPIWKGRKARTIEVLFCDFRDHQVATAKHFEQQPNITVAYDETELPAKIDRAETLPLANQGLPGASPRLISTVREFIEHSSASR